MIDETEKPENTPKRRKEDTPPVFRRKEDEVKYHTIDRLVGMMKYFVVIILIILYILYATITDYNKTNDYQLKLLNDIHSAIVPVENKQVIRNVKAFAVSADTSQCKTCHANNTNVMYMKKDWKIEDFKSYVRGTKRDIPNSIMPKFTEEMIKDQDLEKMYFILKDFSSE